MRTIIEMHHTMYQLSKTIENVESVDTKTVQNVLDVLTLQLHELTDIIS